MGHYLILFTLRALKSTPIVEDVPFINYLLPDKGVRDSRAELATPATVQYDGQFTTVRYIYVQYNSRTNRMKLA